MCHSLCAFSTPHDVCVYAFVRVCVCMCMCVCARVRVCVCVHIASATSRVYCFCALPCSMMCMCVRVCMCMCVRLCVCECVCVHARACTCNLGCKKKAHSCHGRYVTLVSLWEKGFCWGHDSRYVVTVWTVLLLRRSMYGVASISRLLKIIGFFYKKAL